MTGPRQLRRLGYVIVFEDLSDLLKAQKQAAWREVARTGCARDQESADPDCALGRAHQAAH